MPCFVRETIIRGVKYRMKYPTPEARTTENFIAADEFNSAIFCIKETTPKLYSRLCHCLMRVKVDILFMLNVSLAIYQSRFGRF